MPPSNVNSKRLSAKMKSAGATQLFRREGGVNLIGEGFGAYGQYMAGDQGEASARYWIGWSEFLFGLAGGAATTKLGNVPLRQLPAATKASLQKALLKASGFADEAFSASRARLKMPNRIVEETVDAYITDNYQRLKAAGGHVIVVNDFGPIRDGGRVLATTHIKDKIIYLYKGWEKQDYVEELCHFRQAIRDGYWDSTAPPTLIAKWEEQVDVLFRNLGFVSK